MSASPYGDEHPGRPDPRTTANTFVVMLAVTIALLALIVTLGWVVYYRLIG